MENKHNHLASRKPILLLAPKPGTPTHGMTKQDMENYLNSQPPTIHVNSTLIKEIGLDFAFVPIMKADDAAWYGHPSHNHDDEEYIWFHGSNPKNLLDFGAEIEITLGTGKDEEKHMAMFP